MKTRLVVILLLVAISVLAIERFVVKKDGRLSIAPPPSLRTADVRDVIEYSEMTATTYRVRSTRDVLPGGYSLAMAPVLIDWDHSDVIGGDIVVRNVNHGGNPVSGITVLRSARIRLDKVKSAEYILVPLGGPEAISHGQLRFVFEPGGAEFIGDGTETVGEPDEFGDIVLSWEAWRSPGVDYDAMKGMDPHSYELTARAYSGPQRFLEDELNKRDWSVFALQLPGGKEGVIELLTVSLALADGAARHSIGRMLERADDEWATQGPGSKKEGGDAAAEWRALGEAVRSVGAPAGDPRIDMTGKTSYQSLLRSCATMALYSIDVAVARLIEAGMPHEGMGPTQTPDLQIEPDWMVELATASIAGIFVHAPKAIQFVRANPTSIPGRIPGALDKAGLLVREDGKPVRLRYSLKAETPWGHRDQLLIR